MGQRPGGADREGAAHRATACRLGRGGGRRSCLGRRLPFAEYLSHWVGSIPLTTIETVAQHVKLATFSLESAQRSIAASWAGYASSRTLGPVDAQHCLRRATRYVGYRLLQRALEMDQLSPVVSLVAACHVQLGARILAESDRAMTELLGFPSGSGISG